MSQIHNSLTLHFMASEPVAVARKLELVNPEHAVAIIKSAPISSAVNVLKSMSPSLAAKLFIYFSDDQHMSLTQNMDIADLAAILRHVDKDIRMSTLKPLSVRKQTLCNMLISYPEYTVGSVVETNVLIVDSHMEIAEVLLRLKKRSYSYLQWLYVVNQSRQLLKKIFIGDLLQADLKTEVGALVGSSVEAFNANSDVTLAMEWDAWNHNDTLAIVNKKHEFVGIIHFNRLRHFMSIRQAHNDQNVSLSSDLLEVYGDTIVSMVDLVQSMDQKSEH